MTKDEALEFLRQHQPMPPDEVINDQIHLIEKYDEVIEFFKENPDEECIPLILNSFGEGVGFGVYQIVDDTICKFSREKVIPHLIEALKSKHKSVQFWSGQIASLFPDVSLLEPLEKMLNSDDGDVRSMAVIALDSIKDHRVIDMLSERLLIEKEENMIEFIKKILDDLKGE